MARLTSESEAERLLRIQPWWLVGLALVVLVGCPLGDAVRSCTYATGRTKRFVACVQAGHAPETCRQASQDP